MNRGRQTKEGDGMAMKPSETTTLPAEIKKLPDRLRWIADNATHHSSAHWLKTQLYGLAREFESGWFADGKMGFCKVENRND